jgi:hypothetical protein
MIQVSKGLVKVGLGILTLGAIGFFAVQPSIGQEGEAPGFQNLQVLPENIDRDRLIGIMRNWEAELGVECEHCHVDFGRNDPRTNMASDEKQPKLVARLMLENLISFNRALTPDALDKATEEITRVQCGTCHRGEAIPDYEIPELD